MSGKALQARATRRRAKAPGPLRLLGNLDHVSDAGLVIGWCWSPDAPQTGRTVAVLVDGIEAARTLCGLDRADLRKAGLGHGTHGFEVTIPPEHRRAGVTSLLSLRDLGTGQIVGGVTEARWSQAGPAPGSPAGPQGNVDGVTRDGRISGWCWRPDRPDQAVTLIILVDGAPVGTVAADGFREDLLQAGIGRGAHGFSFAIPWSVLADKGLVTIAVQDHDSFTPLGPPMTLRLGGQAGAEDRMAELERQIRLLSGQVTELRSALDAVPEERPAGTIYDSLAQMFQSLARGGPPELPGRSQADLRAAITALQQRHAPFTLDIPDRPLATLAVPAQAPVAELYRCLASLRAACVDRHAEIVLVDDAGQTASGGEVALLPSVVRNLRYLRLDEGVDLAACLNALARSAQTDMLAVIAPGLAPEPGWLETLADTLAREPDLALVGSRVVGRDGLVRHAGLLSQGQAVPTPLWLLADAAAPGTSFLQPVEALGVACFGVRRAALLEAGGFQPGFATLGHATVELCLRLRADGHGVAIQPVAGVCTEPGFDIARCVPDLALDTEDCRRIRQRWFDTAAPRLRPVRPAGHALVIDTEIPRPDHDAGSVAALEQMKLLRRLGYRVTFAAAGFNPDGAATKGLESHGIEVVRPPAFSSVSDYLTRHGAGLDLVQIYRYLNVALFRDRVRALAPSARLIFSPADLHHLREARRAAVSGATRSEAATLAMRDEELACVREADATILNSDFELDLLRDQVNPDRLRLLRWVSHPSPSPYGFAARNGMVFVGGFRHGPNVDGICWFAAEVLPRLRVLRPGLVLHIAGSDLPKAVAELAAADVIVHGWVADLAGLLGRVRLSVAPLRYGAGFKGKVATSLSHGVPVVGSAIAFEGTGLATGPAVALAETAEAFAEAVIALHDDGAGWAERSAQALACCRSLYSAEAAMGVYAKMLRELGLPQSGKEAVLF